MKNKFYISGLFLLVVTMLNLAACGGGSKNNDSSIINDTFDINQISPDMSEDISKSYVNTFPNQALITSPTYADFGRAAQGSNVRKNISITNNSAASQNLSIKIVGFSGAFRLVEGKNLFSGMKLNVPLNAGATSNFKIEFDTSVKGVHAAYVEIKADQLAGVIQMPIRGEAAGAGPFQVVLSSVMCGDDAAPTLDTMDFMNVAFGQSRKIRFKVCNRSQSALKINDIKLLNLTTSAKSQIFVQKTDSFGWAVRNLLDSKYFTYFSPSVREVFQPPQRSDLDASVLNPVDTFSLMEINQKTGPKNILIGVNSYAEFEVTFNPGLNSQSAEGFITNPLPYSAKMMVDTSQGMDQVSLVGASSGKDPLLEASYEIVSTTDKKNIDLYSSAASISFGQANIYEGWVPEDVKLIKLKLKNVGTGSKALKIWMDPFTKGYFNFIDSRDYPVQFPVVLKSNEEKEILLGYSPTPPGNVLSSQYDLGQLIIRHTGANGPTQLLTLVGEQKKARVLEVFANDKRIKNGGKDVNFCNAKIGDKSEKIVRIINHSSKATLQSRLSISDLTLSPGNISNAKVTLSEAVVSVPPNSQKDVSVYFQLGNVQKDASLKGKITVNNSFSGSLGTLNPDDASLSFSFNITAAVDNSDCAGASGKVLDGEVTLIIDRITMILTGIFEPARNLAPSKTQIKMLLDKAKGTARMEGLAYDPVKIHSGEAIPPYLFRAYNHQITNVAQCFPVSTNPYKQEWEKGSWTDDSTQCSSEKLEEGSQVKYQSYGNKVTRFDGSEVCIPDDGAVVETESVGGVDKKVTVFYHEFAKFSPDNCDPEFEGKISTFYLKEGQTVGQAFSDMKSKVGLDGTIDQYRQFNRMFQFGSYIKFYKDFNEGGCNYKAGDKIENNPDALQKCWDYLRNSDLTKAVYNRPNGMMDECSYFYFNIEEGCVPGTAGCSSTMADKSTWKGFGEYEPRHVDAAGNDVLVGDTSNSDVDDNRWDVTMRNVKIEAFSVVHGLNKFFGHESNLLYSPLYVTLTTKPVGAGSNWQDLMATNIRKDFTKDKVALTFAGGNADVFVKGINAEFTIGEDSVEGGNNPDGRRCLISTASGFRLNSQVNPLNSCRGNYVIGDSTHILPAGEPVTSDLNNRLLFIGLSSFHGEGNMSPGFARQAPDGTGRSMYFTLHGCLAQGENGVSSDAACYSKGPDLAYKEPSNPEGEVIRNVDIMARYKQKGIIKDESEAQVNFRTFNLDRSRYTNYFNFPNQFYFDDSDKNYYKSMCYDGM